MIFTPFSRLDTKGQYESSGIGLAICRKIVEHHHGQIRIESELGSGTTFHFTLSPAEVTEPLCATAG